MTRKELKKISLQYRTLAAQMLKVNSQDEMYCIQQFYDFITQTPYIYDYIISCRGNNIDFKTVFKNKDYGSVLILPSKQEEMVDYGYHLLGYILDGPKSLISISYGYSNSRTISDNIEAFVRKTIEPFVIALRTFIELGYIDIEDENEPEADKVKKHIFLSYCQKDADIANYIDDNLSLLLEGKAKISRDIRDVDYHGSFKKFMQSIEKHDYVIMLISDNYLKSRNCMYEMLEVVKDSSFADKLLFIVITDEDNKYYKNMPENAIGADVYSNNGVFKYTRYWQGISDDLQNKINEVGDPTLAIGFIKEKRLVQKILLDLPDLFDFLKDNKGLPLREHVDNHFSKMVSFMNL